MADERKMSPDMEAIVAAEESSISGPKLSSRGQIEDSVQESFRDVMKAPKAVTALDGRNMEAVKKRRHDPATLIIGRLRSR